MMITTTRVDRDFSSFRAFGPTVLAGILVIGSLAAFSPAAAADPAVVDQYTEQIPSPDGSDNQGDSGGSGGHDGGTGAGSTTGGSGGGSISPGGNDIQSGAAANSNTASDQGGSASGGGQSTSADVQADDSQPAVSSVAEGLVNEGSNGMGLLFPLILLGSLALAAAFLVVRRSGKREGNAS